ncbi:MAG: AraC family transcriptional regulator [Aquabacterium sp.]|uniref:GyrI-like domain-containing protein n=1 Tax=Aquabacterium sp. TaxID=1872578 RepID=UPI00122B700F|nr:GyrI-like domain-containing protein [Aquabacterium sp.]TAK99310.1 MAG: AraC family transcriptional regulator [Aquabacterium sp.]
MNKLIAALSAATACLAAQAKDVEPELVKQPETVVIAVRTANGTPAAYAEAFGKLVGYYAQPSANVKVVFPQRSITIKGTSYAAIAVAEKPAHPSGVELITLPACRFLSRHYTGHYDGIEPAINQMVNQALATGWRIDQDCGVRIHHLNSPDNTPIDKLQHIIYVPVVGLKP